MFDRCIYFNINSLTRSVNQIWDEAFGKYGLSPAHAYMLRFVLANPGQTQTVIASELNLAKSTITRFVDHLAAKGLVKRVVAAEDRRESVVFPTEKAIAIHAQLEETGKKLYSKMRKLLHPENFDKLVLSAREARDIIESRDV
jgi:DNA-binding MarR family transcriptional regulator